MSSVEPGLPFTAQEIVAIRQDLVDNHPASERTSRGTDAPCVDSAMQAALQGAYYVSLRWPIRPYTYRFVSPILCRKATLLHRW